MSTHPAYQRGIPDHSNEQHVTVLEDGGYAVIISTTVSGQWVEIFPSVDMDYTEWSARSLMHRVREFSYTSGVSRAELDALPGCPAHVIEMFVAVAALHGRPVE